MNCLLLLCVLLPITFDVVLSESSAFNISENWDCFVNLNTSFENHKKRREMYEIYRKKGKPVFTAFLHQSDLKVNPIDTIKFRDVKLNVGGHYNETTGLFKAPVNGRYFFQLILTIEERETPKEFTANIVTGKSASSIATIYLNPKHGTSRKSVHVIFNLEEGQEVWIRNGEYFVEYGPGKLSVFSGFLEQIS
ncbi:hypothetical protein CHS0354_015740 [Potamilus streckersoni]|uniref:C1q domain-containing protein n=1 Tax=Potamilus streckersoni TaxID=2493646 RepID=A0AAE0T467_9BIVA|nr:hypothetical protein CHS0354_015740 [Potamilus streckersoni]